FKSTDSGANWIATGSGLPSNVAVTSLAIDPQHLNTVYVGTFTGVFRTTDGGASWNAVNSGLTMLDVSALVVDPHDPNRLYAGTRGGGVFTTNFVPDSVVTELRFDPTTITIGLSYFANLSGSNLTPQTFFDMRFRVPGSTLDQEALNW